MKECITILIFIIPQLRIFCQNMNYFAYHDYINKAESFYFNDNNVDSSLFFYDKAFAEFDYVFVKDPLIAAQIAFYNKKPFKNYLIKGFGVGLEFDHLSEIRLFDSIYNNLISDDSLRIKFSIRRKLYLQSIDFSYRYQMSREWISDQLDKHKNNYDQLMFDRMGRLLNLIDSKGFPGAKIIGIDDNLMFSEIGKPELDAKNTITKYAKDLKYLGLDEEILSTKFVMIILYHNICSFVELKGIVNELIARGEVHPREIGFIYDHMFMNFNNAKLACKIPARDSGVFKLNQYQDYSDVRCSKEVVDIIRKKWHIVPLSVDIAKKDYEKKFGFKLFYGFWGCL